MGTPFIKWIASLVAMPMPIPISKSVANTAINQSGKAVECVLIILVTYALLSAVAAGLMNVLNTRVNRGAL